MKKAIWILLILLMGISIYAVWAYNTQFEVDPEFDRGHDTPIDLIRTIYNPIFDDTVTFVKFSAETEGAYTLLEIDLAPGGGNATHFHNRFNETFIPIDGRLGVEHEGKNYSIQAGEQLKVLRGESHRFFNSGEERIRFQVKIEPGSAGFEKALFLLYGLTNDGMARGEDGLLKSINHTALFLKLSDTRVPGLFNLLNPIFKNAAQKLEDNGEADKLLTKYYFNQRKNDFD